MELLLIRHARPHRLEQAEGKADPSLNETGIGQADALAAWSTIAGIDAIYSSPLRRALETAAPMAERLDLEITVDEDLAEMDRHFPFYIPYEELDADDPRSRRLIDWAAGKDPESDPARFQASVAAAMDRIVTAHPGGRAAVVCHGGVINTYVAHVLELDQFLFFEPRYTSVSRVRAAQSGRRGLYTLNEVPHLPDYG